MGSKAEENTCGHPSTSNIQERELWSCVSGGSTSEGDEGSFSAVGTMKISLLLLLCSRPPALAHRGPSQLVAVSGKHPFRMRRGRKQNVDDDAKKAQDEHEQKGDEGAGDGVASDGSEGDNDGKDAPPSSALEDQSSVERQEPEPNKEKDDSPPPSPPPTSDHSPASNSTRPGVMYLGRPFPSPYVPAQPPRPGLLSALLMPRPQHPPMPFGPPPSPPSPLLGLLLRLALISFSSFLMDLLGWGQDHAVLPTPSQHYTFERVNDRHSRDGAALMQALKSPPKGVTKNRWKAFFHKRRQSTIELLASSDKTEGDVATLSNGKLYNKTVVIVEASSDPRIGMAISEQLGGPVSFLIEQHRDHLDRQRHANDKYQRTKFLPRLRRKKASPESDSGRTIDGVRSALGAELEVVLILNSPGGSVVDFGLAASHLARIRHEENISLTVCCDRVAASGGYMIACQADTICGAPFAVFGSIGVMTEALNFHEVLRNVGIKPISITAGKNKAPIKPFGEVSDEDLQLVEEDLERTHEVFINWVSEARNIIPTDDWKAKVCTGSVFHGEEALELGLIDRLATSDEYIAEKLRDGNRILRLIHYRGPQRKMKISPLDLLTELADTEGRMKLKSRMQEYGRRMICGIAPLCRVGLAVGLLNHMALYQRPICT